MNESKTIYYKKYSNRRIYDITNKQYVVLNDIKSRIREGYNVIITDNENKKDITTHVLTQIILQDGKAFFSSELLHLLIKLPPYYIADYLEEIIKTGTQTYMKFMGELKEQYSTWMNLGLSSDEEKTNKALIEFTKHFLETVYKTK